MTDIQELLKAADPVQVEQAPPAARRELLRKTVIDAAPGASGSAIPVARSRILVLATVLFMIAATLILGSRTRLFVGDLQAAVRFEVRLAEDQPAFGLQEVKLAGSDRRLYLHQEIVVTNTHIVQAGIVETGSPSQFRVSVEFSPAGAERMRAATGSHLGRPIAILLDDQVVMAPTLRSTITSSAVIDGDFTRAQAERIVEGIRLQ